MVRRGARPGRGARHKRYTIERFWKAGKTLVVVCGNKRTRQESLEGSSATYAWLDSVHLERTESKVKGSFGRPKLHTQAAQALRKLRTVYKDERGKIAHCAKSLAFDLFSEGTNTSAVENTAGPLGGTIRRKFQRGAAYKGSGSVRHESTRRRVSKIHCGGMGKGSPHRARSGDN